MSIKIGTADVTDIKIGTTNVNHVYVGSTLVWQRGAAITYELSLTLSYSSGTYIPASGSTTSGVTATLTVKLITYVDGIYDSEQYVDADSGYPDISNEPSGCNFSVTRTSLGTYTISADSRGSVVDSYTDATITVKHTPSGSSQLTETETVSQQANALTNTQYDEDVVFVINSSYTSSYSPADASGDSWSVTSSATQYDYEKYTYTSGYETDWIQIGSGTGISAANIAVGTSGTGLSGSGNGTGTTVTWDSRGTVTGSIRAGYVEVEYDVYSDTVAVYQEANALEYTDNKVITSVLLDGVNGNITIPYTSDSITVSGSGTCTEHYTSGSSASGTFTIGASGFSVSGTGFSYSNYVVSVTENSGSERQGTVTASYSGATSVQRTITQEEYAIIEVPSIENGTPITTTSHVTMKANIIDNGGATITACGFQWGYTSSYGNTEYVSAIQSGEISKQLGPLIPNTTIYWRAFATNSQGTTYTTGTSSATVTGKNISVQFGTIVVGMGVQYPAIKLTNTTDGTDITDLIGALTIDWSSDVYIPSPYQSFLDDSGEEYFGLSATPDIDGGTYAVWQLGSNGTTQFNNTNAIRTVSGTITQDPISDNNVIFGSAQNASANVSDTWNYLFT